MKEGPAPYETTRGAYGGTKLYISPEIYKEEPYQTMPADIWAMGVTLYQMLTGLLPFTDVEMIKEGIIAYDDERITCWDGLIKLWPVLEHCLRADPTKRASIRQLKYDPLLS